MGYDVRFVKMKMPIGIKGLAVKSCQSDGDFYTALINEDLSENATKRAVLHEIEHVSEDDFTSDYSVSDIEMKMKYR